MSWCICTTRWISSMYYEHCWCPNVTQFHDGTMYMSGTGFCKMDTISSCMKYWFKVTLWLTKIEAQKLLKLDWQSLSGWGRDYIAIVFVKRCGQCIISGYLHPIPTKVTQPANPIIVDTPLILIFQNSAVTVSLSVLPTTAASRSVMYTSNQITSQFPHL